MKRIRFPRKKLKIIGRILRTSWRVRTSGVIIYALGAIVEIASTLTTLYATAKLGGLLAQYLTDPTVEGIWLWLWIDIAAAVGIALGFWLMSFGQRLLYFSFVSWSTNKFIDTLNKLDYPDFYDEDIRNEINKVSSSYTWQIANLSNYALELMYGIVRFLAITLVVAQVVWWLVPLIIVFLIPSLIAESRVAAIYWFVFNKRGDERHIFWGLDWIIRQAKGQLELRSMQAADYVRDKIHALNTKFYRNQEKEYRKATRTIVPSKILEVAGTAIGSIVLLRQFLAHEITLDRYLFLSGALLRIGGALNAVFGTLTRMQEPLQFAESYFNLIDRTPKHVDKPHAVQLSADEPPKIEFKNVSFTYPGQTRPVFTNLSLTIRPGEHVALVGENGAGKSTLIKLLLRFYQPTSGHIYINDQDLQAIAIGSLYTQLATLFQDFNQYPFPINENITVGRADHKPNQDILNQAAKFGGIDKLVRKYPHGWETVLDASFKKGIEPSGGQWQRVALSRAFYRQAQMLILDEPTSAIDAKAEYDIFNNIFDHYGSKTALIVSHRFSTVRRADRIIVLDKGKIVEQGTHKELMQTHGLYHDLFTKQAEGYKD